MPNWPIISPEEKIGPEQWSTARSLVTANTYSIHMWHEMWRRAGAICAAPIPPGSLLGQLLDYLGIECPGLTAKLRA